MCLPKIGSSPCVYREILNMEFFFHKQYGIFIPKRLPACCFKANEAIELEPKNQWNISSFLLQNIFASCNITRTRTANRQLK